jgi:hypothetical protein
MDTRKADRLGRVLEFISGASGRRLAALRILRAAGVAKTKDELKSDLGIDNDVNFTNLMRGLTDKEYIEVTKDGRSNIYSFNEDCNPFVISILDLIEAEIVEEVPAPAKPKKAAKGAAAKSPHHAAANS